MTKRKQHRAAFKAKVAMEALRGEQTLSELAAKHGIHQSQIATWKRQAMEGITDIFAGKTVWMDKRQQTLYKRLTPQRVSFVS